MAKSDNPANCAAQASPHEPKKRHIGVVVDTTLIQRIVRMGRPIIAVDASAVRQLRSEGPLLGYDSGKSAVMRSFVMVAYGFMGGFFGHVALEHSTSLNSNGGLKWL